MALRRSHLLAGLLAAACAALAVGCSNAPSSDQCEKVVRHVIDLEAESAGGSTTGGDKAILDKQKTKVWDAVSKGAMSFCQDQMSVEQVKCGLKARSLAELSKTCDKG